MNNWIDVQLLKVGHGDNEFFMQRHVHPETISIRYYLNDGYQCRVLSWDNCNHGQSGQG